MRSALFRFYAELNDFLNCEDRGRTLVRHFDVPGSVKDSIESFGVPHTEVDLILINGEASPFTRIVQEGDRVSVYPVFESLDISPVVRLRPEPLRELRFLLDVHLGRLASYLRMAGFDAEYSIDADDEELAAHAAQSKRVLLTRDRYLLMRGNVQRGYWVRSTSPRVQLAEVLKRFDLAQSTQPFTRCLRCNRLLLDVPRKTAIRVVPPGAAGYQEFRRCPQCRKVFWKGSHHARMKELLDSLVR